jgi:hypothetical protein
MPNPIESSSASRRSAVLQYSPRALKSRVLLVTVLAITVLFFQTACLFKKSKPAAVAPSSPIRIVYLPFNVPAGNKDLRWTAMAAPIVMAKISQRATEMDPVPLWESMPTALEAGGDSRSFTPESAAYVATWLSAKWAAMGELTPVKKSYSLMVDFIPAKSTLIAFRYIKPMNNMESVELNLNKAISQFLAYLVLSPLPPSKEKALTISSLKRLAEAVDREYGWSVEAEPGKAQDVAESLARSDERLARFLFNPTLYPFLAKSK